MGKDLLITAIAILTVLTTDSMDSSLSEDVKIIIASVTVFVANSTLFIIIGFLCRYFHPKPGSIDETAPTRERMDSEVPSPMQNVELKENVAYIPVQL